MYLKLENRYIGMYERLTKTWEKTGEKTMEKIDERIDARWSILRSVIP